MDDRSVTGSAAYQPAAYMGTQHILLIPNHPDIDRIAGNALRGAGHHRQFGKALLVLVVRPQRRQCEIGQQDIDSDGGKREQQRAAQPPTIPQGPRLQFVNISHDQSRPRSVTAHISTVAQQLYRRVSRQPAASASSVEQNQRVPLTIVILICAYQRLVGL